MTIDPAEIAEKALTQPPDSYFGNDNLWIAHGMSGFHQTRDSDCVEKANFRTVLEILEDEFGPQDTDGLWWGNQATHWAVGWVDQIMVKILIDADGKINDINNITPIFKRCVELHDELESYPVLDDQIYSELIDEVTVRNVELELPVWTNSSAEEIVSMLNEMEIYPRPDENGESTMFMEMEIYIAAFMIGNHETDSVWFDSMVNDIESILDTDYSTLYKVGDYQCENLKLELIDFINFANN